MSSTPVWSKLWKVPGHRRRVHLEVHAQGVRLQRARQYTHHVSDRMGQFENSRATPSVPRFRTTTDSRRMWSCLAWRRGSSLPRSAELARRHSAPGGPSVFRIDHDEHFNQTTHLQYQPWKRGPWLGFNWRYDSGLVAGPVPCFGGEACPNGPAGGGPNDLVDVSGLTPDQQFQAGLFCGNVFATPTTPISSSFGANLCPASQLWRQVCIYPGARNGEYRPQSATHPTAELVRHCRGPRQSVQWRPLQMELALHGDQSD